jgi:signal peptide peptidase SppA
MPLPTPDTDEEKDRFISRCMGDETMNRDFPDESQRRAVCEKQWDKDMSAETAIAPMIHGRGHILRAVSETPWAILPATLAVVIEIAARYASGEKLSAEEVALRTNGKKPTQRVEGDIAVLPLFGVIVPRSNLMSEVSGATSAERFGATFKQLVNDSNVGAIVIDADSPGGAVTGVDELSQMIYDARGSKPIVAVANHLAASAAYWIATAADELVVTPSAEVGGIGVFAAHEDLSMALEKAGIKTTLISAGKFKTEASPYEPLTVEARAAIQQRVDEYYTTFTKAVARNRGVPAAQVRDGFGEGRVVGVRQAISLGMADRVATMEAVIGEMMKKPKKKMPMDENKGRAELEFRQRRARMMQR